VGSSCEFGIELSGSIKWWGNYPVSKQLGISGVVLNSMELVCDLSVLSLRLRFPAFRAPYRVMSTGRTP
jgi:hypothetical protein